MPSLRHRRPRPPAPVSLQDRDDLIHLQFTHGVALRLRLVDPDGCTDLADEVRSVVGGWLWATGSVGPPALVTVRLWLRERLAADQGTRTVLQTQDADELLCAALASEDSGLAIVPLQKRQCA